MSVFSGIEHVSAEGTSSARQYFEEGNYVVEINSVFLHEKRLGGGKLFIVETTIKESNNPRIKPGEQRNWAQSMANSYALPRIKSFIAAAVGLCPKTQSDVIDDKVDAAFCNTVIGPQNPLKGRRTALTCINKVTRSGKNFTHLLWGAYEAR